MFSYTTTNASINIYGETTRSWNVPGSSTASITYPDEFNAYFTGNDINWELLHTLWRPYDKTKQAARNCSKKNNSRQLNSEDLLNFLES